MEPYHPHTMTNPFLSREAATEALLHVGALMYQQRLIVACEGNLSARLDANTILATRSGAAKGFLKPEDFVEVSMEGRAAVGKPSTEIQMHLAIFRARGDVGAVVHGHPSWATALATAGRGLTECLLPEVVLGLGKVPLSRYATPGTDEVAHAVCEHITHHDAVLMPNHGVVACGPDPMTAFQTLETVEHLAQITLLAELAGGARVLSRDEVSALVESSGGGPDPQRARSCLAAGEVDSETQRLARVVAEEVARALLDEEGA
ncbi:MAG TPA: class II aldolase/adducin family protein [Candidatus Krumholzibacteria bacterium]|nr:class II aldolase/adducin family protein [Candidatus Krumholzibacteria bacterium]